MRKKLLIILITIIVFLIVSCGRKQTENINTVSSVKQIGASDYKYVFYSENGEIIKKESNYPFINDMETVIFGKYPQYEGGNTKDPIEWLILDRDEKNRKILLLSKYILDCKSFNNTKDTSYEDSYWHNSTLRNWLNDYFYNEAFSSKEKSKIIKTEIITQDNTKYGTYGGEVTEDNIFCLSVDEIEKYFGKGTFEEGPNYPNLIISPKIIAGGTNYVRTMDIAHDEDYDFSSLTGYPCYYYWLRTPGSEQYMTQHVNIQGEIDYSGNYSYCNYGVRPAMWVEYEPNIGNVESEIIKTENNNMQNVETENNRLLKKIRNTKLAVEYPSDTLIDNIDTLYYGMYQKDDNYSMSPIEWIVIDKQDGKALIMTKNIIDYQKFSDLEDEEWKDVRIRKWLNDDFINKAFSDEEKVKIVDSNIDNDYKYDWSIRNSDDVKYVTYQAENTVDKIFLLSADEVIKYFGKESRIIATKPTKYASYLKDNKGETISKSKKSKEWYFGNADFALRSVSKFFDDEYINGALALDRVSASGLVSTGYAENFDYGIRPAMWIKYE